MGLTLISFTWFLSFTSWSGIWWWGAKLWSRNSMPAALQLISACVGTSWLFTVNVQVITKYFFSVDPSNPSTLPTERHDIPKYSEVFEIQLFLSVKGPSFFDWPILVPIPRNLSPFVHPILMSLPPSKLGAFSLIRNLPHCRNTLHSRNTSHLQTFSLYPLARSIFWLSKDPCVQVPYIRQLIQSVLLQDLLGEYVVWEKELTMCFLPDSVQPLLPIIFESDYPASGTLSQSQGVPLEYHCMCRNRPFLPSISCNANSAVVKSSSRDLQQQHETQHSTERTQDCTV